MWWDSSRARMRAFMRLIAPLIAPVLLLSSAAVLTAATPAGADTDTFTSGQVGTSGSTSQFTQTGPWEMSWSYNCDSFGEAGNFVVNVNQPAGDDYPDLGVNELNTSGSGVDYYYDTGVFNLSVTSECNWSITVQPASGTPDGTPVTFTSTEYGETANPPEFTVAAPWQMTWSYNCANLGQPGNFIVGFSDTSGAATSDVGPNELAMSGSGTDSYSDSGTFQAQVLSECQWSIALSSASSPPPAPAPAPQQSPVTGMASTPNGGGYWTVNAAGAVTAHGNAVNYGDMAGKPLNAPMSHIVATPSGKGYWLVAADGGTFAFGDAGFFGSMGGKPLNAPVVDMAPTNDGNGYWLVASDGGVFAFGDASFEGSMGGRHLNEPVVGIVADDSTGGYWEVATDGGIFAFNAPFYGSTGNITLNKPVNGMAATVTDQGYWFVASDGGIFAYGNAQFYGSTGNMTLNAPIVGMAADPATGGYWLVGKDGGIFSYDAPFLGAG